MTIPAGPTLAEFLDEWLTTVVKPFRRPNTYTAYEMATRVWIVPHLGEHRLQALTYQDVQRMVAAMVGRGVPTPTVRHSVKVLRTGLERAVRFGIIDRNPATRIELPPAGPKAAKPLTREEAGRFLAACKGERLGALFVLALCVGMRRGELLGLPWLGVDWRNARVSVTQQLVLVHGQGQLGPLKSAASTRTVNLPAIALEALRQHRGDMETAHLRAGSWAWKHPEMVFVGKRGGFVTLAEYQFAYRRIYKRAGITPRRGHDLRHTAASLLLEAGVNPRVVMETLGHASIAMTLGTYSHVNVDVQTIAARAMDDLLGGEG